MDFCSIREDSWSLLMISFLLDCIFLKS